MSLHVSENYKTIFVIQDKFRKIPLQYHNNKKNLEKSVKKFRKFDVPLFKSIGFCKIEFLQKIDEIICFDSFKFVYLFLSFRFFILYLHVYCYC